MFIMGLAALLFSIVEICMLAGCYVVIYRQSECNDCLYLSIMSKWCPVQEKTRFWRVPELEDLEILHATYVTHSFVPHSHASFVTSVIDRGVGKLWYRGRTHLAPAGSLVLLNPGEIHTGQVV